MLSDDHPRTLGEVRAQREYQNNMHGWEDHADDFVGSYSSVGTLIEAKQKSENPSLRDLDTRGRERARQKIYPHRRSQSPPRLKDTVFEQGKELGKKTIVRVAKDATPEPVKILAKMMVPYIIEGAHGVKQGFVYIGDSVPGARTAGHFVKDVTVGGLELLDKTLDVMPTAMRRTARTLGLPQNWAQNLGDATHLLQEIGLIVMPAVKAIRMERATSAVGEVARPKGIISELTEPSSVRWVDETATMNSTARAYNDSVIGARSNVHTKLSQAPSLYYKGPDGKQCLVRFDGIENSILIDRKIAIVTTDKAKKQAMRQAEALKQNFLTGRWEVPNLSQQIRAKKMLDELKITNIDIQVVNVTKPN